MLTRASSDAPVVASASRWARFTAIGAIGLLVQLAALWVLTSLAHWAWLTATLVSVELAVVHNFLWHVRWTWRDRPGSLLIQFVRFQLSNGVASIAGNAALMSWFAGRLGWPPVPANVLAVATMSVVNFVMADRWVFRKPHGRRLAFALCAACLSISRTATAQSAEAIGAWERYVAATEVRLERSRASGGPPAPATESITASGESVRVPSGTISDWRGSVFIRGITLDRMLQRLQHPGTPPPQEDVVSSRVLARTDDSLRVSIRLVRRAIVTVTYDTEHEMRFRRWTPRLATARSIATRIAEVGGSDHGFLWRLHSYWRYEEIDGGVRVDLESLTLSRDVPSIVRPIAAPLITRIARESMVRTLEAFQRFFSTQDSKEVFRQTRYPATTSRSETTGWIDVPCDRTRSWYAATRRPVTGPMPPAPICRSSTESTGTTSAPVPQMNASFDVHTSNSVNGFSSALMPRLAASASSVSRVTPFRLVAVGGVSSAWSVTMKKLSTVASAT